MQCWPLEAPFSDLSVLEVLAPDLPAAREAIASLEKGRSALLPLFVGARCLAGSVGVPSLRYRGVR